MEQEFKSFPITATILTILAMILSVVSLSLALMNPGSNGDSFFYGLSILAAAVLFLAGLTTGKVVMLKVISTIVSSSIMVANFVLAIAKFTLKEVELFPVALLMLVACILNFIYFVANKSERIRKMYIIANITLTSLTFLYAIIYMTKGLYEKGVVGDESRIPIYFILLGYVIINVIPMIIYISLKDPEEPKQEEPKQIEE